MIRLQSKQKLATITITKYSQINNNMTTTELLKEAQRLQLEIMNQRLPIHIGVNTMPEFGQVSIYINGEDHKVVWSGCISDHPMLKDDVEDIYNEFISVVSKYTVVRQAS